MRISDDAQTLMTAGCSAEALRSALHLLREFFPGTTGVYVDAYAEPYEGAEPHFSFEVDSPLDRAAFRQSVTQYFSRLRKENNPIHLILAVVKR